MVCLQYLSDVQLLKLGAVPTALLHISKICPEGSIHGGRDGMSMADIANKDRQLTKESVNFSALKLSEKLKSPVMVAVESHIMNTRGSTLCKLTKQSLHVRPCMVYNVGEEVFVRGEKEDLWSQSCLWDKGVKVSFRGSAFLTGALNAIMGV